MRQRIDVEYKESGKLKSLSIEGDFFVSATGDYLKAWCADWIEELEDSDSIEIVRVASTATVVEVPGIK